MPEKKKKFGKREGTERKGAKGTKKKTKRKMHKAHKSEAKKAKRVLKKKKRRKKEKSLYHRIQSVRPKKDGAMCKTVGQGGTATRTMSTQHGEGEHLQLKDFKKKRAENGQTERPMNDET